MGQCMTLLVVPVAFCPMAQFVEARKSNGNDSSLYVYSIRNGFRFQWASSRCSFKADKLPQLVTMIGWLFRNESIFS